MLKQILKKGSKLKSKVRYEDQSQSLKLEGNLKSKAIIQSQNYNIILNQNQICNLTEQDKTRIKGWKL